MTGKLALLGLLALSLACDAEIEDPLFIKGDQSLVGTWTGTAEITTAGDIGSGSSSGGVVFPVLLELRKGGRFELIASNFPTAFSDPNERTCAGSWERRGTMLELFAFEACRALPFARYTIGRTLPDGITLDATTATSPVHTPGNIRATLRLERQ